MICLRCQKSITDAECITVVEEFPYTKAKYDESAVVCITCWQDYDIGFCEICSHLIAHQSYFSEESVSAEIVGSFDFYEHVLCGSCIRKTADKIEKYIDGIIGKKRILKV